MLVRSLLAVACIAATSPAFAQVSAEKAAQNASNWDVFQKLYPPRALAAKEEGAVGFVVTLDRQGDVTGCRVTHSSGHPLLDEETCKVVTQNAQFSADPSLGPSQTKEHEGLINWRLPNGAAALSAPQAIAEGQAPDKVVCKKTLRTGTIGGYERTCMTQREWARQSDEERDMWADIQGKKGSSHGN